jgi:hypothetical protein
MVEWLRGRRWWGWSAGCEMVRGGGVCGGRRLGWDTGRDGEGLGR